MTYENKKKQIKSVRISKSLEMQIENVCSDLRNMGVETTPAQMMRIGLELVFQEPEKLVDKLTDGRVLKRWLPKAQKENVEENAITCVLFCFL